MSDTSGADTGGAVALTEDALKSAFDTVLARVSNFAAAVAADWAIVEGKFTNSPIGTPPATGSVTISAETAADLMDGITKFGTIADSLQNLGNGMVPPATVTSPVTGTTSTATVTDDAHVTAAAAVNGDVAAQQPQTADAPDPDPSDPPDPTPPTPGPQGKGKGGASS